MMIRSIRTKRECSGQTARMLRLILVFDFSICANAYLGLTPLLNEHCLIGKTQSPASILLQSVSDHYRPDSIAVKPITFLGRMLTSWAIPS